MGDFIANCFKFGIIYAVFYVASVIVFGGAACMGMAAGCREIGEWVADEDVPGRHGPGNQFHPNRVLPPKKGAK